jgi:hypothetical protein
MGAGFTGLAAGRDCRVARHTGNQQAVYESQSKINHGTGTAMSNIDNTSEGNRRWAVDNCQEKTEPIPEKPE